MVMLRRLVCANCICLFYTKKTIARLLFCYLAALKMVSIGHLWNINAFILCVFALANFTREQNPCSCKGLQEYFYHFGVFEYLL